MTDAGVRALKPRHKQYAHPDPELRGHYVRVTPTAAKSFVAVTRAPDGRQVWTTIGGTDVLTIDQAREQARAVITRVRGGLPAFEPKAETFGEVVANWRKRHVEANGLRSAREINRLLETHLLPVWRHREFAAIRRSDIAALLDRVEDGHSAHQADAVLTILRAVANWYAARHDDYHPPVARGMRRRVPQARARILNDDELSALWKATEDGDTFADICRLCLLTAQRSRKVAAMRWDHIEHDAWTIPTGLREKGTGGTLPLPQIALNIIAAQPRLASNPHVFAGRGNGSFSGFSKGKRRLDAMLPKDMARWTIHDLRRTARSLMSRAGVSSELAERALGHTIGGMEGIYNRHQYIAEKGDALAKLAALIDGIVHTPANVVSMRQRANRSEKM